MSRLIVWFRCGCGQSFSNEVEISEPFVGMSGSISYYFEGGVVFYPLHKSNPLVHCWDCDGKFDNYIENSL